MCWRCGQEISSPSKLLVCQQRTCNKKYHRACVEIDEVESRFSCPWHHCSECGRRTSAHCSFCSTAFCQGITNNINACSCTELSKIKILPSSAHLDGNLFEHTEKSGMVCKLHENADVQKTVEDEKEYSDNDNETDRDSSTSSNSPIVMEKIATREPSPRVSIVEVR